MIIGFASDHAGYALKNILFEYTKKLGFECKDYGTFSQDSVDYPDYIKPCAEAVGSKLIDRGVVVCGSGIGASIVSNKVKNVRCALCTNIMTAKYSRLHNDANIIAIGARVTSEDDAVEMLRIWLNTDFEKGRHEKRILKISDMEK